MVKNVKASETIEARELKAFIARAVMKVDEEPWRMMQIKEVLDFKPGSPAVANIEDLRFVQLCRFCLVDPKEMAELIKTAALTGNTRARDQIGMLIQKGEDEKLRRLFDA